jgi:uncharacterized protein with HEPN domain
MPDIDFKDRNYILNMLDAIEKTQAYSISFKSAEDFNEDGKAFDASMMNFIVIGEMAVKISDDLKDKTSSDIDWSRIKAFRNILAHNYFGIDADEVWQIIHHHLPDLEAKLKGLTEQ